METTTPPTWMLLASPVLWLLLIAGVVCLVTYRRSLYPNVGVKNTGIGLFVTAGLLFAGMVFGNVSWLEDSASGESRLSEVIDAGPVLSSILTVTPAPAPPTPRQPTQAPPTNPPPTATLPPPTQAPFDAAAFVRQGNRYDCPDFPTHAQAQAVLRADARDPNRLDGDGDGIVCEDNLCPCDPIPVVGAAEPAPAPTPEAQGVTFLSVRGAPLSGTASVSVQTAPGVTCSIAYVTPAGTNSSAQGLVTRITDSTGRASWSWTIGTSTRPGVGAVAVYCNGLSAAADIRIG